jgi:uncharacterized membrane protein YeaQ/YmgE (transglycosylase-associated protein family)
MLTVAPWDCPPRKDQTRQEHPVDDRDRLRGGPVARLISPAPNNPGGFVLTTLLGIVGAFLTTYLGQAIGWYRADEGAGLIGATMGALIVLFIWHLISRRGHASST